VRKRFIEKADKVRSLFKEIETTLDEHLNKQETNEILYFSTETSGMGVQKQNPIRNSSCERGNKSNNHSL
jgi:hypothetical protein